MKPVLTMVQGDANGIGPELLARLLTEADLLELANPVVISDPELFKTGCEVAGVQHELNLIERIEDADFNSGKVNLIPVELQDRDSIVPATASRAAGAAVLQCYGKALDLCADGRAQGVCFMPFNKDAMHQAGLGVEDETQWARQRLRVNSRVSEFNVIDGMWNARVTSHVPLKDVADLITEEHIIAATELASATLKDAGFENPRIAIAALNPHAGDGGNMGREEIETISPAVERCQQLGLNAHGPFPSDTLYIKVRDGEYDCAVSMYHDQGQIAIKLLGFQMGVSVHAGLPFPVTTPAHGTAFDIVGTNTANLEPSRRAFQIAARMASTRLQAQA